MPEDSDLNLVVEISTLASKYMKFWSENLIVKIHFGRTTSYMDWIILEWIVEKQGRIMWTGFIWIIGGPL
jgi:hypothetical protein